MDYSKLPRMIDLSCVKAQSTEEERNRMVQLAKQFHFVCCFAMPCFTPWLVNEVKDDPDVAVGATIGFPSGADLTKIKVQSALMQKEMGCGEFDMVINVGALKDRNYAFVERDIRAVREALPGELMKVILEVAYLNDYEICKGAEIAASCGVNFIKTGTGWASKPTTVDHIRLLKKIIGDDCQIKAAGGVRTLADVEAMMDAGCTRFGIGIHSTESILKEAGLLPG